MQSIVYENAFSVATAEREKPILKAGEVLIKVAYAGICGSDMNIYHGVHPRAKAPLIMGHEFSGTVVEGETHFKKGTKVTLYPLVSCGTCEPCQNGYAHVCDTLRLIGIDSDGGMAEFSAVPADKLVAFPEKISLKHGAFLEPLAVGVHAVRRSNYKSGDKTVIFGAGPIGLSVALALRHFGALNIVMIEANPYRLKIAEKLGFLTVNANSDELIFQVKSHNNRHAADVVFDCAAHPSVQKNVMEVVRVQGNVVIVGSYKKPPEVDLLKVEFKELTITGIRVYEKRDFAIAINMLEKGIDG